jgi:hypothetical protein
MKRKIDRELKEWKKRSEGSVLRLVGAPAVGKTYSALAFANDEYESHLLIDFKSAGDDVRRLFRTHKADPGALVRELGRLYGVPLPARERPGAEARTLIIFDDISFCPKAREALPLLAADARFDFIETESALLGKKSRVAPMPCEETVELLPLDFEEFAAALGEELLADFIRQEFEARRPLGALLHRKASDLFRCCLITGGMPEAVNAYAASRYFSDARRANIRILKRFRRDLLHSADARKDRALELLKLVPAQLERREKRFRLSDFRKGASMRSCAPAFRLLEEAGILNCTANMTEADGRLAPDAKLPALKCFYADTGLLVSAAFPKDPRETHKKLLFEPLEFKDGMILQNAVSQMLRSTRRPFFYYSAQNTEEGKENCMKIDFLLSRTDNAEGPFTPVFLRLTNRNSSASLKRCRTKFASQMEKPVVLYSGELEEREDRLMVPYYMAHLL